LSAGSAAVTIVVMRGVGLVFGALGVCFVVAACGGKSGGAADDGDGSSGKGGGAGIGGASGGTGGGGGSGGSEAGSGGDSAGASSGGSGGGGGDGGAPPQAGKGGTGGGAGAGSGGAGGGSGGSGGGAGAGAGNGPVVYDPPEPGDTWQIESGDPLNSTPPVLLAVDDGVVIAGASSDPETVGLTAFESGKTSEAFVARLDADGMPMWRVPLLAASLPWAIARSADDVVIVAPYLPELAEVSTSYVSKDIYVAKVGLDGTVRYETSVTFDHESTFSYGLAVDATGALFLAGGVQDVDPQAGFGGHPILIKCDPDGAKLWERTFEHTGTQGYANDVEVLPSGDVVMTGAFDRDLSFGGTTDTITSSATLDGLPSGFVARFTTDGEPVWADAFGGEDFSVGTGLAALANGDFLLAGAGALDVTVGGITVMGEPYTPSDEEPFPPAAAFVARLSGDGTASWVTLEAAGTFAELVETDGGTVYLAGNLEADLTRTDAAYFLTYDAVSGESVQAMRAANGAGVSTSSLAVGTGSAWVSGRFTGSADFGNTNLLTNANAGVFLLRLAAQ